MVDFFCGRDGEDKKREEKETKGRDGEEREGRIVPKRVGCIRQCRRTVLLEHCLLAICPQHIIVFVPE